MESMKNLAEEVEQRNSVNRALVSSTEALANLLELRLAGLWQAINAAKVADVNAFAFDLAVAEMARACELLHDTTKTTMTLVASIDCGGF